MPNTQLNFEDKIINQKLKVLDDIAYTGNSSEYFKQFATAGNHLALLFCEYGDEAYNLLNNKELKLEESEKRKCFIIISDWAQNAKFFMILWQDMLLQQQKAYLMFKDQLLSEKEVKNFYETSLLKIKQSLQDDVLGYVKEKLTEIETSSKTTKKKNNELKNQVSPWEIYKKHISQLNEQINYIQEAYTRISETSTHFLFIKKLILESTIEAKEGLEELLGFVKQLKANYKKYSKKQDEESYLMLRKDITGTESILHYKHHADDFNVQLEKRLEKLAGVVEFPVEIKNGVTLTSKINFESRLNEWMNRDILPLLSEIWEALEVNRNGLKMALQNSNFILTEDSKNNQNSENRDISVIENLIFPFSKSLKQGIAFTEELSQSITHKLQDDMRLSSVYNPEKYFLLSDSQLSANNIDFRRFVTFRKIVDWATEKLKLFKKIKSRADFELSLSSKEKIVRFIRERSAIEEYPQYSNFFITKGYYGDSFSVATPNEMQKFKDAYANWEKGFSSSVLLTGKRFSGKTLFGEKAGATFFSDRIIRLSPASVLTIGDKSAEISYDLHQALEFVQNEATDKNFIWIDDLELWQDMQISVYANARKLAAFIDSVGTKFFCMVSLNMAAKDFISKITGFDKAFQSVITLPAMTKEQVEQAIMIRHLATQKKFVNNFENDFIKRDIRKNIQRVYRQSKGNIGDALKLWAIYTNKVEGNQVVHNNRGTHKCPDFLSDEKSMLLRAIFLQKQTSLFKLRRQFGPEFTGKYSGHLRRLSGMGVLYRNMDGRIEINDSIVNEVAELLCKANYIEYQLN